MAGAWKTVRVFISSTFRDMHAERDHLVKVVFPALRERLERHRVHLVDVDLRWGVTREQADNDRALDVCLDHIEACRPFFIGILGERYGYVAGNLTDREAGTHDWVRHHGGKSITELEIMHGVLNNPAMQTRALFLFRDPSFLSDVPAEWRKDFEAEDAESAIKLGLLKQAIRDSGMPLINYGCGYDGIKPDGGVRLAGLEQFGREIGTWLGESIEKELQLRDRSPAAPDPMAEEDDFHERFLESRLRVYVGRASVYDALVAYAESDESGACLVTGGAGSGKSAALARFVTDYRRARPQIVVVPHFIGASAASTDPRQMLRRFCLHLKGSFEFIDEVPNDFNDLSALLRMMLGRIPADHRVVLVIDALNQMDPTHNAHTLTWIPARLPVNVRVVASCLDDALAPVMRSFTQRPHRVVPIRGLDEEERRQIIRAVPSLSAKALDELQIDLLLDNQATANPLLLLVALEELRGFGSFDRLDRRIVEFPRPAGGEQPRPWLNAARRSAEALPVGAARDAQFKRLEQIEKALAAAAPVADPLSAVFTQVISRLESDFDPAVTAMSLTWLASARRGLSQRELLDLVEEPGIPVETTRSDLFPVLRQLRPYLLPRGELLDFYHGALPAAARHRYLDTPEKTRAAHMRLAEYFDRQRSSLQEGPNTRKADELPFQLTAAQNWVKLVRVLRDLSFLEMKAAAGLTDDLIEDFGRAQEATNHALVQSLGEVGAFVRAQSHVLRRHADLTYQQAANQPASALAVVLAQEAAGSRYWLRWLNKPERRRSCLLEIASRRQGPAIACVDAEFTLVAVIQAGIAVIIDTKSGVERLVVQVGSDVRACCFSSDGAALLVGDAAGRVTWWDARTGHLLREQSRHAAAVTSIDAVGEVTCSAAGDGSVAIWDLSGRPCATIVSPFTKAFSCALHPNSPRVLIGGPDARVELWDYARRECLANLRGSTGIPELDEDVWSKHHSPIVDCRFAPDGRSAVAAQDGECSGAVYRLEIDGDQLACPYSFHGVTHKLGFLNRAIYLEGGFSACDVGAGFQAVDRMHHLVVFEPEADGFRPRFIPGVVRSRCVLCRQSPDGRRLLTVDDRGSARVWDLTRVASEGLSEPQALLEVLGGAVSPAKSEVIVCRDDGSLVVWDAARRRYGEPFGGDTYHDHARTCVAWTRDGERIVAGGEEYYQFDVFSRLTKDSPNAMRHRSIQISSAFPAQCEMAPDDSVGLFVTRDGTIAIRSLDENENRRVLRRPDVAVAQCRFVSPEILVISWGDGLVTAWDWPRDRVLWELRPHEGAPAIACDPHSERIVTAGRDGLLVMHGADGREIAQMSLGMAARIAAWSPCGRWLAVVGDELLVIEISVWEVRCRWCPDKPIVFAGFMPEPNTLAVGSADGEILLLRVDIPRRR